MRSELLEGQVRLRRRSLLVGVALLAIYLPLDLRLAQGRDAAALRLGWLLLLAVVVALQQPRRPRTATWALRVGIVASGLAGVGVVALAGGTESPRFGFLLAFPLTILVLFPDLPASVAIHGATCLAGGVWLIVREGRDRWFVLEWGTLSFALTALAVVGSLAFRRLWYSESQAHRARAEALERLAESERLRARSERLAVVGRLAAGVAHEINNPLAYVKANVGGLREEALGGEAREALDEALQGIERISQIVSDMRGLVRDGPEALTVFGADQALEEAWRLASVRLQGVQATWDARPGLPILGNRRLLVQALVNLVVNAADAALSAPPERRWVRALARRESGGVVIDVEDGGPGIPAEVAEHLFEPFTSTKGAAGTGLGLALVREHVAQCGGTIEAGSHQGGGARFTIRLPAAP